jgi:hypothetical protein
MVYGIIDRGYEKLPICRDAASHPLQRATRVPAEVHEVLQGNAYESATGSVFP